MELPIATGDPIGPRGGTHRARGSNIPIPRYHRYHITHAGPYSRIQHAFSEPTLLKAAKGVLYPHVEGTVTHRALLQLGPRKTGCKAEFTYYKGVSKFLPNEIL